MSQTNVTAGRDGAFLELADAWEPLGIAVYEFKNRVRRCSQETENLRDLESITAVPGARSALRAFANMLDKGEEILGPNNGLSQDEKDGIGSRWQEELLPHVLSAGAISRMLRKPRGYPGDFETLDLMYQNQPSGRDILGVLADAGFLACPAAAAVRNRRRVLADFIQRHLHPASGDLPRITTIACGPARELFDVLDAHRSCRIEATLFDLDQGALDLAQTRMMARGRHHDAHFVRGDVIRWVLRNRPFARAQDLVYSIGLIDYFPDDLVVRLLGWIHTLLRPGGQVVLGNFHPKNPNRAIMDHVLEWKLIHRTEEDMMRLLDSSPFKGSPAETTFEPAGVNLFLSATKSA